jgi:hypothetical protein
MEETRGGTSSQFGPGLLNLTTGSVLSRLSLMDNNGAKAQLRHAHAVTIQMYSFSTHPALFQYIIVNRERWQVRPPG